jgi:hypothetical protein
MLDTPYSDVRKEALDALSAGEPQRAFALFRWALEYPGTLLSDDAWRDALSVFAQISAEIADDEFAEHVRRAANRPNDTINLYELGNQLIEQSLHGIAATILTRAHQLLPGREQILTELVCALEGSHHNHEACRVLREAGSIVDESFLCRYLLAYNALMTGDIEEPRRLLPALSEMARKDSGPNNSFLFMAGQIGQMLDRAAVLADVSPLDGQDLRGWHFIINGGLLLHLSPYGFDEGMNGRYAYTHDSDDRCLAAIRRLDAALKAWKIAPPRVFVVPDRESTILAHAVARVLDLPAEPWPEGGSESPGLLVVYDLDTLDGDLLQTLYPHRPGQILFCHAACWTAEPPFVADVTTYLYQINKAAWQAEGRVEELAEKIVTAKLTPEALSDLPALIEIAEATAKVKGEAEAGALRREGNRRRQRKDSPVKSSHF